MSGKDERENRVLETTMTPAQAERYRIEQQECLARSLMPTVRQIFYDAKKREANGFWGFWLGNLHFTSHKSSENGRVIIATIRCKKGFLSAPIVFKCKHAGRSWIKIEKFRNGAWVEELASAKILSDALLREYSQELTSVLDKKHARKRKKRMQELGLDTDY